MSQPLDLPFSIKLNLKATTYFVAKAFALFLVDELNLQLKSQIGN